MNDSFPLKFLPSGGEHPIFPGFTPLIMAQNNHPSAVFWYFPMQLSACAVKSHFSLGPLLTFGDYVPLMDAHVSIVRTDIKVTMET